MKSIALPLALALCACTTSTSGSNTTPVILDAEFHPINRGWGKVWEDQFNGPTLDSTKWVAAQYCGGYNGEQQCYTRSPHNLRMSGGELMIIAWASGCSGSPIAAVDNPTANEVGSVSCGFLTPGGSGGSARGNYASGRIHTRVLPRSGLNDWTYGRIEIRAVLPEGRGTWPAFWMLPATPPSGQTWPQSGEIDIMEAVNLHTGGPGIFIPEGDKIQSNIHFCSDNPAYPVDPHASQSAKALCGSWSTASSTFNKVHKEMSRSLGVTSGTLLDLTGHFHTYALEWTDVDMRFFVDDQLIGQVAHGPDSQNRAPFRQPFYLIINLAIGGAMPGMPEPRNWMLGDRTVMRLDWVRVYACANDPTAKICAY
jgi:hypothetical protein